MKIRLIFIVSLFILAAMPFRADAALVRVPEEYSSIQNAVNICAAGDTVLIGRGIYYENINNKINKIVIASHFILSDDPKDIEETILDGRKKGSVIEARNSNLIKIAILGLTIQNGDAGQGGGVYANSGLLAISDCIIRNNDATKGGGIYGGSVTLTNTDIYNNFANEGGALYVEVRCILTNVTLHDNQASIGGGIAAYSFGADIRNSVISHNIAINGSGLYGNGSEVKFLLENTLLFGNTTSTPNNEDGETISIFDPYQSESVDSIGRLTLNHCTLVGGDSAVQGDCIKIQSRCNVTITNSVIISNKPEYLYFTLLGGYNASLTTGSVAVTHSAFGGNASTISNRDDVSPVPYTTVNANGDSCDVRYNFIVAPDFVDASNGDFSLKNTSRLIGAGTLAVGDPITTDIRGNRRGQPHDIGAFECDLNAPEAARFFTLSGRASIEGSNARAGIAVTCNGTNKGDTTAITFTDSNGYYTLLVKPGTYTVTLSKPGSGSHNSHFCNVKVSADITLPDTILDSITNTIFVPEHFLTIQDAINNAVENDSIIVAPGEYRENITIGKTITLGSYFVTTGDTSYISSTIINGDKKGRVVTISNKGTAPSIIGLTLTGGFTTRGTDVSGGAGIFCEGADPILSHLIVTGNVANENTRGYAYGGGLYFSESKPVLRNIVIQGNRAVGTYSSEYGGGIWSDRCELTMENCVISDNSAVSGGGIWIREGTVTIENCLFIRNSGGAIWSNQGENEIVHSTFVNNSGSSAVVGQVRYSSLHFSTKISNSIIANNDCEYGISGCYQEDIICSNIFENGIGNFTQCGDDAGIPVGVNANGDSCDIYLNISCKPGFVDFDRVDFRLADYSHLIGAGDAEHTTEYDILGNRRGSIPDMGAYENPLSSRDVSTVPVTGSIICNDQNDSLDAVVTMARIGSTDTVTASAGDDGIYRLDLPRDIYDIIIEKDGYYSVTIRGEEIFADHAVEPVKLVRKRGVLNVPEDFPTISVAVEQAVPGDSIFVAPGKYFGVVDFFGKPIVIASHYLATGDTSLISRTVIYGDEDLPLVKFVSGEDSTSVLIGFTVMNHPTSDHLTSIGVLCNHASPQILHTRISGFPEWGINILNGSCPIVRHCVFSKCGERGNTISYQGDYGCILCDNNANPVLSDIAIFDAYQCGIRCTSNSNAVIDSVSIVNKVSMHYSTSGIISLGSSLSISNFTFQKNGSGDHIYALICSGGKPTIKNFYYKDSGFGLMGSLIVLSDTDAVIENISITNCGTTEHADCFSIGESHVIMKNVMITGVDSDVIRCFNCVSNSDVSIYNATISGNTYISKISSYGVRSAEGSTVTVVNSIINGVMNGVYRQDESLLQVSNSNLWGNVKNFYNMPNDYGTIVSANRNRPKCDVYGNMFVDPGFIGGGYTLSPRSPLINAGTKTGAPEYDINGYPRDEFPDIGAYEYDGSGEYENDDSVFPVSFNLGQCRPNPFNPQATIDYAIPAGKTLHVRMDVYDIRGALVKTLVDETKQAGYHTIVWNGTDSSGNPVSSGMYICRIQAGGFNKSRKMLLLR